MLLLLWLLLLLLTLFLFSLLLLLLLFRTELMTIEARARCYKQFMLAIAHRSTTNESLIVLDFAGFLCVFLAASPYDSRLLDL